MYAFQSLTRIYAFILLCVCAALFPVPSLATSPWDIEWYNYKTNSVINEVQRQEILKKQLNTIHRPTGTSIVPYKPAGLPAVTSTTNSAGGLSAKSTSILSNGKAPTSMTSSLGYSAAKVRGAALGCLSNKACASRLGTVGILAAGLQGWMDVYDYFIDDDGTISKLEEFDSMNISLSQAKALYPKGRSIALYTPCPATYVSGGIFYYIVGGTERALYPGIFDCWGVKPSDYDIGEIQQPKKVAVPLSEIDSNIGSYNPEPSDMSMLGGDLINQEPDFIDIDPIAPVSTSEITTTLYDPAGNVIGTQVTNNEYVYNVQNNGTPNPSIQITNNSNTTTYDQTANITGSTSTSTTELPSSTPSAPVEFELPAFCTWAEFLCDWLNWTKEPLDEQEPDLSVLISEFEPDEGGFSSGIGSGSCPAPMSLNLGIISQTVEVSYQPFCDFLAMIRPLVIAGAWLISAFMYVGVLRRG